MVDILYEDQDLIVCVKPVGVLSQPGTEEGEDMLSILNQYLKIPMPSGEDGKKQKGQKVRVGLVHRLDRNVGGVMVFSKKDGITSKLSQAVQERDFRKEYYAVVHNCPEEKRGIYKDYLFKDSSKNKSFVVTRPRKGVKEASLEYEVADTKVVPEGILTLVRIRLHTGRTHQIRVQFSSRKMPLLGDGKYGSKENGCEIALWSFCLAFCHPGTGKELEFSKEPPDCYPWNLFCDKSI